MSKRLTMEELKTLVGEALTHVISLLESLTDSKKAKERKRASLLSYWIKDYVQYIREEDSFDPKKLIRYKRGDILQVEFGYRIGRELGGRHYAVVIDTCNGMASGLVTVVPLTSLKKGYKENYFTFVPEKGVYELVKEKLTNEIRDLQKRARQNLALIGQSMEDYVAGKITPQELQAKNRAAENENKRNEAAIAMLKRQIALAEHLKPGTVIDVGQVVTVSKMRITNPKMRKDTLYGIRLDPHDMDTLDQKLKQLYIHE